MGKVEWLFVGGGLLACVFIARQDFRERQVHVFWLLLLLGCGLGWLAVGDAGNAAGGMPTSMRAALLARGSWMDLGFCLVFLTVLMAVLGLYLRLRGMGFLNRTFGLGDLVFLVAAAPWLGAFQYVLFFTTGALIGVLFGLLGGRDTARKGVPFAGVLAGWLLVIRTVLFLWANVQCQS